VVVVCNLDEVLDLAFPASLAVMDVISEPYIALVDLETMRHEKEYPLCPWLLHSQAFIVHFDDKALESLFPL
jgi:hypothetical protein